MDDVEEVADRPLYETIANDLLEGIRIGKYPAGSMLPTEAEIAAGYSVSRQTVRAAMARLQEAGAISRRAGSGTRVEERRPTPGTFSQVLASLGDLVDLAEGTKRDIRGMEFVVLDRRAATRLGAKPGSRWLKVSYLRRTGRKDKPLGWSDVYIPERYAGVQDALLRTRRLYSELIEERFGVEVAEVRQEVTAVTLSPAVAASLNSDPGQPSLQIIRQYVDRKGDLLEVVVALHPGERCSVKSVLNRVKG
jgi:GntR family transcriptional regulator